MPGACNAVRNAWTPAWRRLVAGALVCLLPALPIRAQESIALKIAHAFPAGHGVQTDFLQPWARDLEQRSGRRARVSIHDGGTPLGDPAKMLERLQAGEVDIVHGLPGAYPERFPRTNLMAAPFLAENAAVGSRILWSLKDRQLKAEYAGLKLLALHTDNGGLIHTGERKVAVPEDLKGLRLRSPSAAVNKMLTGFGATALGMPPTQVFANLRAGLIDGALFSWDGARQYRVAEVARHHLDARVFTTPYFLLMTQKRYQSLPAPVRTALDEISGAALVERFGPWWDKWDRAARDASGKRGGVVTSLSSAQRDAWAAKSAAAMDRYLAELTKAGVRDAKAVYTEMKKAARRGGGAG